MKSSEGRLRVLEERLIAERGGIMEIKYIRPGARSMLLATKRLKIKKAGWIVVLTAIPRPEAKE